MLIVRKSEFSSGITKLIKRKHPSKWGVYRVSA